MKKVLSILICLLLCVQLVGAELLSAEAEGATLLFEDDFSYASFGGGGLYDGSGAWEREYATPKDSQDAGSVECTAPAARDGVLYFAEGDGIRLNWQKLEGFSTFDANKTYTVTFDVTVTDFGDDAPRPG